MSAQNQSIDPALGSNEGCASGPARPRILVAHNVSPGRTGGMSRIMGFIHDEIARSEGWQVDWFCADRLTRTNYGPLSRFAFPWELFRFLRREFKAGRRYDAVNVHEPIAALPMALKKMFGRPNMVVTSHGLEARAWEVDREEARLGRRPLPWRSRLARPLTLLWPARYALRSADHVFCLNSEDRQYLTERLGAPPERSTRIFPGATALFAAGAPLRDYRRAERLLFAGTWRHHKGTPDLTAAFALLAERRPALTLTVLGAGVPPEAVQRDFPAALQSRVEVVPSVNEPEAARRFAEADLFVLPSLFEGTPLTLIEAMASGLPIVTTRVCGMRDVIRHRENGLLAPTRSPEEIAACLEELLQNRELREKLGRAAARDAAEHYQWTNAAAPALQAYRTLFSRKEASNNS